MRYKDMFTSDSEPSAAQTLSLSSLPHSLSSPLTCSLSLHSQGGRQTDLGLNVLVCEDIKLI